MYFGSSSSLNAWRMLLALAVVFVMLATTGWTAIQHGRGPGEPLQVALKAWDRGRIGIRKLPDPAASPQRLAAFFASLTSVQRRQLVTRYPLVVGNLNGAPLSLRYRANRLSIAEQRLFEQRRSHNAGLSFDGREEAAKLLAQYDSMLSAGRQFIAFDPSGTGRAAEVFGDLSDAQRVSVVVPGVDTNLMTFQKINHPYTAPVGMGSSLYAAERVAAPSVRTAVIAWGDYTAPPGIGIDAATGTLAKAGAIRLNAFLGGLPGRAPVSLFCHSYGSVVCGVAAPRLPSRVSDLAVAGSPGMRVRAKAQLHTDARVWATRDHSDWIQDIPYLEVAGFGHGADPMGSGFGARLLSAAGAVGHGGYFTPGTRSLENFADIGVGSFGAVDCASSDTTCRDGIAGA